MRYDTIYRAVYSCNGKTICYRELTDGAKVTVTGVLDDNKTKVEYSECSFDKKTHHFICGDKHFMASPLVSIRPYEIRGDFYRYVLYENPETIFRIISKALEEGKEIQSSGKCYGHPQHSDGTEVLTSQIIRAFKDRTPENDNFYYFFTKNTCYLIIA